MEAQITVVFLNNCSLPYFLLFFFKGRGQECHGMHVEARGQLMEVNPLHHMGFRNQTHFSRFDGVYLLSHLVSPTSFLRFCFASMHAVPRGQARVTDGCMYVDTAK